MKTPTTMGTPQMVNIAGFRSTLVLLHAMFLTLYVSHLQVPETGILGGIISILAALTIMVFIVPSPQLCASWFLSLLILGNGGILLGSMPMRLALKPE